MVLAPHSEVLPRPFTNPRETDSVVARDGVGWLAGGGMSATESRGSDGRRSGSGSWELVDAVDDVVAVPDSGVDVNDLVLGGRG